MRKFLVVLFIVLACTTVHAADVWMYKIQEVTTPSLLEIQISFTLFLNGENYASDAIRFHSSDLVGTAQAKLLIIDTRIRDRVALYIGNYEAANGLKTFEGREVTI